MDMESVEEKSKLEADSLSQKAVADFKDIYESLNQIKLFVLMKICQNKDCIIVWIGKLLPEMLPIWNCLKQDH